MQKEEMKGEKGILKRDIKLIEKEFGILERKIWHFVFHFHYRKIFLLLVSITIAYIIFRNPGVQEFTASLGSLEYLGIFVAGVFLTFGFTAPLAVGFFIILHPANPLLVALVGGIGSLIGDLVIFYLIRFSFMDEFQRLEHTRIMKSIGYEIKTHLSHKLRLYLLYALAGLIIASPLPDEAGVIMLAGLTKINVKSMVAISFLCHSIAILIMCLL